MRINKKKVIIIIIICIVFFGIFIVIRKMNKDDHRMGEVSLTPEEMIEMLSCIPYSMVRYEPSVDAYVGNRVIAKDVVSTILSSSFLLQKVDTYKLDDITDEYTQKTMKDSNIQNAIFLKEDVSAYLLKSYDVNLDYLKKDNDKVKIIDAGKYIAFLPVKTDNHSIFTKYFIKIDSTYANKREAIIYEKAIFYRSKDDKYYIYKNSNILDDSNIVKVYDKISADGKTLKGSDIANILKEYFADYNYKFKHTFKKNKNGYYWYSTELIEDNK